MAFKALHSLALSHFQSHSAIPYLKSSVVSNSCFPLICKAFFRHVLFAHTPPSSWNEAGQPVWTIVKSGILTGLTMLKKLHFKKSLKL